jgi:hypothetical protein
VIRKILRLSKAAGPEPIPVAPTRYDRWTARVMDGQLDFWSENWANLNGTQQYADWQRPLDFGHQGRGSGVLLGSCSQNVANQLKDLQLRGLQPV